MTDQNPRSSRGQSDELSLSSLGTGTSRTGIVATFLALSGFSLFGCSGKEPSPEIQAILDSNRVDPSAEIATDVSTVSFKDALVTLDKKLDVLGQTLTSIGAGRYEWKGEFHLELMRNIVSASNATLNEIFKEQSSSNSPCSERMTQLMTLHSHLGSLQGIFSTSETYGDRNISWQSGTSNSNPAVFHAARGYIEAFLAADGTK